MPEDFKSDTLFGFLQTGIEISIGAAQKSIEAARNPQDNAVKLISEMRTMLTVPENAGPEFQDKAQAMAGMWLGKGMTLLAEFKTAGGKFTEGK
jgi:hypothetical protein